MQSGEYVKDQDRGKSIFKQRYVGTKDDGMQRRAGHKRHKSGGGRIATMPMSGYSKNNIDSMGHLPVQLAGERHLATLGNETA